MLKKTPPLRLVIPLLTLLAIVATAFAGTLPSVLADAPPPLPSLPPFLPVSLHSAVFPLLVFDIPAGNTATGTKVGVYQSHPSAPNEVFVFIPVTSDGYGYLASVLDKNRVLDIENAHNNAFPPGENIIIWTIDDQNQPHDNQLWKFNNGRIQSRLCVTTPNNCQVIGFPHGDPKATLVAWTPVGNALDQIWIPTFPQN